MSHMPPMQCERGAPLPGMLGILGQQQHDRRGLRASPQPYRHSPVHRDSFAAFYETPDDEFHVRESAAAPSGSLEDIFELDSRRGSDQRRVRPMLEVFRQDTIKSMERRYEAHRKASRVHEAYPSKSMEEPQK